VRGVMQFCILRHQHLSGISTWHVSLGVFHMHVNPRVLIASKWWVERMLEKKKENTFQLFVQNCLHEKIIFRTI